LLGAARAAELSGDRTKEKGYYADLIRLAAKSDGERPELARAKEFSCQELARRPERPLLSYLHDGR
jgi:hypothetical protein